MRFTHTFDLLVSAWKRHPRYIDSAGGTRSGKTFSVLQLLVILAMTDKVPTLTSVVSETMPHLKRGAIRDFKEIMGDKWDEAAYNKTDNIYTFASGSQLEFFSADQPQKVAGPARDRLFINEAVNISWDTARQLFVRTKGFIVCDYNPTHAFWMHQNIAPRPNCISITTTYKDNEFLSAAQIEEIESNRTDTNWWRVYGEGKVGQLDGLIYDFEQIDALPEGDFKECYGMDFGFTNDPTSIVRILADTGRKELYVDEIAYATRMRNCDIIQALQVNGVPVRSVPIYADCAEPKSIADIAEAGYNIKPCTKDAPVRSDKMKFQIDFVRGWRLNVTKSSVNTIRELRNYTWAKDKDGNFLNTPIDKFNHALDALRYGVFTHLAELANHGRYSVR